MRTSIPFGMHPKLRALLDLWHSVGGGGRLPSRTLFDPFTLQPWLGHLSLAEEAEGGEFRIVLEGTEVVTLTGRGWTGHLSSEVDAAYGVTLTADLRATCESGRPRIDLRRDLFAKSYLAVDRVLLPVLHEGRGVRQVILALYESPPA